VDVRFEDLLREPIPTLRRSVQELGLSLDEARLQDAVEMISPAAVHPARATLDEDQRFVLGEELGDLLKELGYAQP
jgi:hypothetical protein